MKKCRYYIGCLGVPYKEGCFKQIRFITDIDTSAGYKIPKFDFKRESLEFNSEEADGVMHELIEQGWLAVTVRVPKDRKNMCTNYAF